MRERIHESCGGIASRDISLQLLPATPTEPQCSTISLGYFVYLANVQNMASNREQLLKYRLGGINRIQHPQRQQGVPSFDFVVGFLLADNVFCSPFKKVK